MILTDDASGVRAAVEHLVDCGYRRIAYVEGEAGPTNAVRSGAAAAALRDCGVRTGLRVFPASADAWRTPGALADAVRADPPDALMCYDDKLALALMDALRQRGTRVPDQLGIVGFDGIPYTTISNPRLTTVSTPTGQMGRLAAASLIRAIREGSPPEGRGITRAGPAPPGFSRCRIGVFRSLILSRR